VATFFSRALFWGSNEKYGINSFAHNDANDPGAIVIF
jgi:hypothetical protein